MVGDRNRTLSQADKEQIFRRATAGLAMNYAAQISAGMTDDELEAALRTVLGIFGGSGGPNEPWVEFAGAGLRIWGGWHHCVQARKQLLFAGQATIAMAREVYRIGNPSNLQLELF